MSPWWGGSNYHSTAGSWLFGARNIKYLSLICSYLYLPLSTNFPSKYSHVKNLLSQSINLEHIYKPRNFKYKNMIFKFYGLFRCMYNAGDNKLKRHLRPLNFTSGVQIALCWMFNNSSELSSDFLHPWRIVLQGFSFSVVSKRALELTALKNRNRRMLFILSSLLCH